MALVSGRTTQAGMPRNQHRPASVTSQTPVTRLLERERDGRYVWPQMRQRADDWKAAWK